MNIWDILECLDTALLVGLVGAGFAMSLIPNPVLGYIVGGIVFIASALLGVRWRKF